MPFEIIRNDIANMHVDVIVNTANPKPIIGPGVDSAIHKMAGDELLEARKQIGEIAVGDSRITEAFQLHAKYVIHTVGPIWNGGLNQETELLRSCYRNSLELALKYECESIAFPLISTGAYGFPKEQALETALGVISSFLMHHEMMVYLVVFDKTAYALSEKLFKTIETFIDEKYAEENMIIQRQQREDQRRSYTGLFKRKDRSLVHMLHNVDITFSEALLQWIIKKGKTEPEVYKKANVDRKLFSKIKNNKNYRPSKGNAVALAVGLELSLAETKELIGKAGYALTHSSKFDIIIEYFISHGNYDVFEINEVLFAFDQPLIGGEK